MTEPAAHPLRFVLVRTSHPGNIGAAARAIRTMGFEELALVAPQRFPDAQAEAMAAGALDVLARARVWPQLADAIGDCTQVLGLSARRRGVTLPELTPREAAAAVRTARARDARTALLFGNEQSGLDNNELSVCHAMVRIPSDETYPSLNLAQAVQVMAYELRLAMLDALPPPEPRDPPANAHAMEAFYAHLARSLDAIDFHKGRDPDTIMQRLRRLFQRAQPDERELRILHGILADAERMAQLARNRESS